MTRKIPMRKCVVTQEQYPKKDLIRIVLTPDNTVVIDETGRTNGRGAYVCRDAEVIRKAMKTRALDQALKTKVPDEIFEVLLERFKDK